LLPQWLPQHESSFGSFFVLGFKRASNHAPQIEQAYPFCLVVINIANMKSTLLALSLLMFVNWSYAQDPSLVCIEELKSNQELQGLFKKIPVDVSKGQSLEVLANNTKPTANEKKLISTFIDALDACSNQGSGWREKNYPLSVNTLGAKYQSDFKIAASDLYGGKLTFGEFAKLRAKMMTEFIANLQAEVAKVKQDKAAREQTDLERDRQRIEAAQAREAQREAMAEETRRQAIIQMIRNQPPIQIQPLPVPRAPVTTNCNAYGNQMNCVTR
jgi:hypothetical protein